MDGYVDVTVTVGNRLLLLESFKPFMAKQAVGDMRQAVFNQTTLPIGSKITFRAKHCPTKDYDMFAQAIKDACNEKGFVLEADNGN